MRSDIATNIRQSNFYSKPHRNMSLNHSETQQNDTSDDHNETQQNDASDDHNNTDDDEEMTTNSKSFLQEKSLIDHSSDDEE